MPTQTHETQRARKANLSLENNKSAKCVHRHDVNSDGPESSTSFIWTPFVKKHKIDTNGPHRTEINGTNRSQINEWAQQDPNEWAQQGPYK